MKFSELAVRLAVTPFAPLVWRGVEMAGPLGDHGLVEKHGEGFGEAVEPLFEDELDGIVRGSIVCSVVFGHCVFWFGFDAPEDVRVPGTATPIRAAGSVPAPASGSATLRLRPVPERSGLRSLGRFYRRDGALARSLGRTI